MSFVQLLSIGFALAACAVPVLLLRRPNRRGLSAGGADQPLPPSIIRNAWIAYALRISVVVPLFALGAAGDLWPAMAGAVAFGAGMCLLAASRPSVALLDEARRRGEAATLHAFVAQACGGAPGLRRATAAATAVALLGLAEAEAAALAVMVSPLLGEGAGVPFFLMLIAAAGLYAVAAGPDSVRYVSQALLGAIHIGLFGAAAFLLYLNASDLRPMPPHGAFALIALTACCVAILIYRQTKYVETPNLVASEEISRWRRAFGRQVRLLQRLANVLISVLAVLAVVLAGMQFYFLGLPGTVRDGFAALGSASHIPVLGFVCIALLALTYPLVDAVSWQCAGALAPSARAAGTGTGLTSAPLRRPMRMVAGETSMAGILVAALGAMAALSTDLPPDDAGMPEVIRQLIAFDNGITDAALTLLLVGLFAMTMSTMGMAISTAASVIARDILPVGRSEMGAAPGAGSADRRAAAITAAIAVVVAAVWIAAGVPSAGVVDARFFALALAFVCLQVSLLPLLLARLRGVALPGPGTALAVFAGGAATAFAGIALYGTTADALWLWLAVPGCLASGLLLLAAAAFRGHVTPPQ